MSGEFRMMDAEDDLPAPTPAPPETHLSPGQAFVLSLLCPGFGQLYNGQVLKAVVAHFGTILLAMGMACSFPFWFGVSGVFWFLFEQVVVRVAVAAEAMVTAGRLGWVPVRRYRHWACLVLLWFVLGQAERLLAERTVESWPVRTYFLPSGSMRPTLLEGDYVLTDGWYYRRHAPSAGDIAVLNRPAEADRASFVIIKRIVGVGGDRLAIHDGALWRNGARVHERYVHGPVEGDLAEFTVPAACVFVMGDNRNTSHDSRIFGAVPERDLKSKVLYIFWPLTRAGTL